MSDGGIANGAGATFAKTVVASYSGTFNLLSGKVLGDLRASTDGIVNVLGGQSNGALTASYGGRVNVSGGAANGGLFLPDGGNATVTGGLIGANAWPYSVRLMRGGRVTMAGGVQADKFFAEAGSVVTLLGGEFKVDGVPVAGLANIGDNVQLNPSTTSVVTGVYADGTPFAFAMDANTNFPDVFAAGSLNLKLSSLPNATPMQLDASVDAIPLGIRGGQTLTVGSGAVLHDNFMAGRNGTVDVLPGGTVGKNLEVIGATVNVLGGTIGANFDAYDGSVINISGGRTSSQMNAFTGSVVNVSGGAIEPRCRENP